MGRVLVGRTGLPTDAARNDAPFQPGDRSGAPDVPMTVEVLRKVGTAYEVKVVVKQRTTSGPCLGYRQPWDPARPFPCRRHRRLHSRSAAP